MMANTNSPPPDPGRSKPPITKSRWYQLLILAIIQVVLTGMAVGVSITIDRRSNHAWCEIVVTLDDTNKAQPPTDDRGRRFADEMSRLRRKLGCD
jgi:hypothetical protein